MIKTVYEDAYFVLVSRLNYGNGIYKAYEYDNQKRMTAESINEVTTEFYWMNGILYGQKLGEEYLYFLHDESETNYVFIVKTNTSESYYYYKYNPQGDIIGIIDSTGNRVVEYTYGAWGDIQSVTGSMALKGAIYDCGGELTGAYA